jgi:hypothetical protein
MLMACDGAVTLLILLHNYFKMWKAKKHFREFMKWISLYLTRYASSFSQLQRSSWDAQICVNRSAFDSICFYSYTDSTGRSLSDHLLSHLPRAVTLVPSTNFGYSLTIVWLFCFVAMIFLNDKRFGRASYTPRTFQPLRLQPQQPLLMTQQSSHQTVTQP